MTADSKTNPEHVARLRCGLDPFLLYTLVLIPYKRFMFLGKSKNVGKNKVGTEPEDLLGNLETLGLTQFFLEKETPYSHFVPSFVHCVVGSLVAIPVKK